MVAMHPIVQVSRTPERRRQPRALQAGVGKAPRHEVAGDGAVLWPIPTLFHRRSFVSILREQTERRNELL